MISVIFNHPNAGCLPDQEKARKYLKLGERYRVRRRIVHDFSTEIYLHLFPGVSFNSVLFDFCE
jgi:hypothetical protein